MYSSLTSFIIASFLHLLLNTAIGIDNIKGTKPKNRKVLFFQLHDRMQDHQLQLAMQLGATWHGDFTTVFIINDHNFHKLLGERHFTSFFTFKICIYIHCLRQTSAWRICIRVLNCSMSKCSAGGGTVIKVYTLNILNSIRYNRSVNLQFPVQNTANSFKVFSREPGKSQKS